MQSVGEVMAIGRTFPESLQKACRSLEIGQTGLNGNSAEQRFNELDRDELARRVEAALRAGFSVDELFELSKIDRWFLDQMSVIVEERQSLEGRSIDELTKADWRRAKQLGFSDDQLAYLMGSDEDAVRTARVGHGVNVTFKTVDTCAAEFEALTPYHYSTYEEESEVVASDRDKVLILGSGPNRIGQGIEFDYCCVHASFALRDAGYETIMVNCNPETVSTDYDTSDRLYFEPITYEDVMNVVDAESGTGGSLVGIVVSLGGQTPLKLADRLPPELVLGTRPESIDAAEDRNQWSAVCDALGIPQPPGGTAVSVDEALTVAAEVGYPALVRPSYVLGGRAMELVYNDEDLTSAMREGGLSAERPVLIDRFLESAIEVDVDAIRDSGGHSIIGGVMEHVEEAGVHSGDSACVLPPPTLSPAIVSVLEDYTIRIADQLDVVGLINVQYAVKDGEVFVIEANPRAFADPCRLWPRIPGRPWPKIASRVWSVRHLTNSAKRVCYLRRPSSAAGRSKKRYCRSTDSRRPMRCSARRCARPARSWVSTSPPGWHSLKASLAQEPSSPKREQACSCR
ncbi:UNVERIFIED_CONTAM: hypothetical protein GTU68_020319 [Idotea baltica]|nr:hypothetical protein [Idotea baltica]